MTTVPNSFESFMVTHQNRVFSQAVRMLSNETDAEDICQEVFLRAYDHFNELRERPSAAAWLRTVTRNLCLNHLSRYRFRWRFFSEMVSDEQGRDGEGDWFLHAAPEKDPTAFDERAILQRALGFLPQAQRAALVLFHFEDLNYAQIAARLRISLSKVKMDIFRGRVALRRMLSRQGALA